MQRGGVVVRRRERGAGGGKNTRKKRVLAFKTKEDYTWIGRSRSNKMRKTKDETYARRGK